MGDRMLLIAGVEVAMVPYSGSPDPEPQSWATVLPTAPGGLQLPDGTYSARPQGVTVDRIVLHWGGRSIHHLYDSFAPGASKSSHFGISGPHVYQFLDIEEKAWHAGWANSRSIGIDIAQLCIDSGNGDSADIIGPSGKTFNCWRCVSAGLMAQDEGCALGIDYREIPALVANPSDIGQGMVIPLDPLTAKTTREFIMDLCETMGIPFRPCDGSRHYSQAEYNHGGDGPTVFGHHSISTSGKVDAAPWWDVIFGGGA